MAGFVRMSKNFVNLGRLYSSPPWGGPRNAVNLGNLYTTSSPKRPIGFAYFEDGSVFIKARAYAELDTFEAEMNLLQPFVRGPSPKLDQIRQTNAERQRLIVIAMPSKIGLSHTILARNAREGERITVENWPFEQIDFHPDASHSHLISATFHRNPIIPIYGLRKDLAKAMVTFRGTLIDGVLQPRTRLGNGLELSTSVAFHAKAKKSERASSIKPKSDARVVEMANVDTSEPPSTRPHTGSLKAPETTILVGRQGKAREPYTQRDRLSKREAELDRREQQLLLLQQQLQQSGALPRRRSTLRGHSASHQKPRPLDQGDDRARYAQSEVGLTTTDPREFDFATRERELHHKEEVLRWKRKAFVLEQKLAGARRNDLAKPPESDTLTTSAPAPEYDPVTEPPDVSLSDSGFEDGQNDLFADLHTQAPSLQRGERRRTRIKLPRRK